MLPTKVLEITGKASKKGDTATHELMAHFGVIEEDRALAPECALGSWPNTDPHVGHSLEWTNFGDKEYCAIMTKKAILGLILEAVDSADEPHN